MESKAIIELVDREDKKHSVKWNAPPAGDLVPKGIFTNIYVNKPFAERAKKIRVTIEVIE